MPRPICAIVGAGEGLGRSLALKFAREGFDLTLLSRTPDGSAAAMRAAADAGARVEHRIVDARQPRTIEQALLASGSAAGAIEVLIYNVRGDFTARDPLDVSYEELDQVFRLEVVGAFAAARAVLPAMRDNGHGSILFSSATAALRGSAGHMLYAVGKFGLRALSQSLAKAYARDGVHIVHVRLDCDLDVPLMRDHYEGSADGLADPDAIAETYWWAHQQPKEAWSNEIELRPFTEKWTY